MTGPGPLRAVARLATELQTLRERTGLSLVALAAKTPYSKSTWARYLNGGTLPPWAAVQALAALADEPEARLRAMWDLAEEEWSGRGVVDGTAGARPSKSATAARPVAAPTTSASAASSPSTDSERPEKASGTGPSAVSAACPSSNAATPAARPASPAPGRPADAQAWHRRRPRLAGALTIAAGIVALCMVAFGIGSAISHTDDPGAAPRPSAGDVVWGPLGCGGQSCDGRDPTAMNCGVDPISLGTLAISKDTSLEIRYKGPCQAAWARVLRSQVGDVLSITADTGATQSANITDPYAAESYSYTPMVPALKHGTRLRACLAPPKGEPSCVAVTVP
jgi:transcriptional regulator with XRE-family HTH domain